MPNYVMRLVADVHPPPALKMTSVRRFRGAIPGHPPQPPNPITDGTYPYVSATIRGRYQVVCRPSLPCRLSTGI